MNNFLLVIIWLGFMSLFGNMLVKEASKEISALKEENRMLRMAVVGCKE